MKYTTPECNLEFIETDDIITVSSAKVESSDEKTDISVGADDILDKVLI